MHCNIVDSMHFVFQYFAYDNYHVESFMFTINTKITTGLVMVCCLLVTANQYIGDPIDCFVDKKNVVPRCVVRVGGGQFPFTCKQYASFAILHMLNLFLTGP